MKRKRKRKRTTLPRGERRAEAGRRVTCADIVFVFFPPLFYLFVISILARLPAPPGVYVGFIWIKTEEVEEEEEKEEKERGEVEEV